MNFKIKLLISLLSTLSHVINAQCDCETIFREDGKIVQCNPAMVAYDNSTQIGIALASNGQNTFITVAVRFKGSASEITDKLHIRLSNNQLLSFELVNSALSYVGNSNMSNAVYLIKPEQIQKLKTSDISTISLNISNGKLHTYQCSENCNIIKRQINCL